MARASASSSVPEASASSRPRRVLWAVFCAPLLGAFFIPASAHAQVGVTDAIRKPVKTATEKQLPKTTAAYKKITGVAPYFDIDWSTFATTADVQGLVARLDGDVATALRKKSKTPDGKAAARTVTTVRIKRQATAQCAAKDGLLTLAADWGAKKGSERVPNLDECLAHLAAPASAQESSSPVAVSPATSTGAAGVPEALRSAVEQANKALAERRDYLKRVAGIDLAIEVDWSTFKTRDNISALNSQIRDLDEVIIEIGKLEGKGPLDVLKKVAVKYKSLATGDLTYSAEATCAVAGGVFSMVGDYGAMHGNASTPPYVECLYSLYPPKVRPVPTPGPVPANIKAAVARAETTLLGTMKATFKDKAGIQPALVIDWATFRSDQEVDAMMKHLDEVIVPALATTIPKPGGKALVQSVKTLFIDQDSNVGGTKCRIDGAMLRVRGAWGSYHPERRDCEGWFERASYPRRGWRDMLPWQKDPSRF